MTLPDVMVCIIFGGTFIGLVTLMVGHSFIDDIFKQKMKLINHMTEKGEV